MPDHQLRTRNSELTTAHKEWLGYLQPMGLVVSPPALAEALAFPNANIIPEHNRFLECVGEISVAGKDEKVAAIIDFPRFCSHVLGWRPSDLVGSKEGGSLPETLESVLTEYHETLRPTYAVKHPESKSQSQTPWMLLVKVLPNGTSFDDFIESDSHHWQVSPQARFERLLRDSHIQVPIGLLFNGTDLRLVYAPKGESSGHLTFPVRAMTEVAGRPIFAALVMLLGENRLFTLPDGQRLPEVLEKSRRYQNLVSTKLAEQVLAALYELLRGFQAADDQKKGELLRQVLQDDRNQVYAGLLTVLLRLVFLLYAEDRGLMSDPQDELYQNDYAITGLFERLRADAGRYTDTMDHRFGSWPQLLALFRMVHDGGRHARFAIPARKGYLFDPDKYPFLEGRAPGRSSFQPPSDGSDDTRSGLRTQNSQLTTQNFRTRRVRVTVDPPHVSDGVVFRVLQNLLILDGERLSYRTLDVEQIGSVYETIMGFILEVAQGRSIAIKPTKPHGAPTTINLEALLAVKPADRAKWLKDQSDQALTGQTAAALKEAATPEDAVAALERKVAFTAMPRVVPAGAMVLQPSEERRRSGSHYTPRSLTEPIVETTFRPILERLGPNPTPAQILDLKVCDPAMGSGAFLVAVCRFLAELLVTAWHAHKCVPKDIPPDEDELLHARRIVAQRCLYGVDKNPMAVDLAKLSLWLATLAKDHPFTFLDHALRCGDSLVGLSKDQIIAFHWKPEQQRDFARKVIEGQLSRAMDQRRQIREAPDGTTEAVLRERLQAADGFIEQGRRYGDLVVSAFFAEDNDRKRKERLEALATDLAAQQSAYDVERFNRLGSARRELRGEDSTRSNPHPIVPFHWEIEFPEVFDRENSGFDALMGNPPFLGGTRITSTHGDCYRDWLAMCHPEGSSNADLSAHFFRRSFSLQRRDGGFGLLATNSIAQGDTRVLGLETIVDQGGCIYDATRRYRWPGQAAVVVCIIHVQKSPRVGLRCSLDGHTVPRITAFLYHSGGSKTPVALRANAGKSFRGCDVFGIGFVFDDGNPEANSLSLMRTLIQKDPRNAQRIFPYIGGEEFNSSPGLIPSRYIIDFGEMSDEESRSWPDLFKLVEERVKPARARVTQRDRRELWWLYATRSPSYRDFATQHERCLAISLITSAFAFGFISGGPVVAHSLAAFALSRYRDFGLMQSRIHEAWARFFASSLEDRLRYTPSDCFETYPFPPNFETNTAAESAGKACYEFRAALMIRNNEGLTKTYNRFHDPDERSPDIFKLRELHAAMDRAVLDAYGWTDLKPTCEFLLDYDEDEEEDESAGGRRRKKPWRYRWPDDFRDEVLARLLELNRQRAEQERLSGAAAEGGTKSPKRVKRSSRKKPSDQPEMF